MVLELELPLELVGGGEPEIEEEVAEGEEDALVDELVPGGVIKAG